MSSVTLVYRHLAELKVAAEFADFVHDALLPVSGLTADAFWRQVSDIVHTLAPINHALIVKREQLQRQLDDWHHQRRTRHHDARAYKQFLVEIGYLVPTGPAFTIDTHNVDDEIARIAGPQLVVPVSNARFALNACNARWGSLYDALYGADVIAAHPSESDTGYSAARGALVIAYGRDFLDQNFALAMGSYHDLIQLEVQAGAVLATLADGRTTPLARPEQFKGYRGVFPPAATLEEGQCPVILLVNNGLHIEIVMDRNSAVGYNDSAGISDIVVESAVTTIMDCEDSVAAVDTEDKIQVYRNWLGLMSGSLTAELNKNGTAYTRRMALDRTYLSPLNTPFSLPGRSLLFVRNVGHLMTSDIILDKNDQPIPEGILDGIFTCMAALMDVREGPLGECPAEGIKNSRTGSIYIVKPKMHGPEEVAFTSRLFAAVEGLFSLPENTVKMGIMDEERRTSVNLIECIRAAKSRVVFINTGFLDRTGDEIHTSMEAGAFAPKEKIKTLPWIQAYETSNVAAGLLCGLQGRAQIGKGMWPMPDNMAAMMTAKISQPQAGASTAWVPSPSAATLHALHYHQVNVSAVQDAILATAKIDVDTMLQMPLLGDMVLTEAEIRREIENNVQGLLGYVVRWVDQGVGCSKVPDIHNVALMEDRATLRIASQHICNWLYHGICTPAQVMTILASMAAVVDQQNRADPNYQPMAADLVNSLAFQAAQDLIFKGRAQPCGYTEPLLHSYRYIAKHRSLCRGNDFF